MKLSLLSLTCILILTSCGDAAETTDTGTTTRYAGNGYTMSVPKAWSTVESKNMPVPQEGTVVLAMTSPEIYAGFSNNLVILQGKLAEAITSKKYSIVNYAKTTGVYTDFLKLGSTNVTFSDKDESTIYTFEAKYNPTTAKQKFVQAAKVCGEEVYLITFGLGLDVSNTKKYEELIQSFTCTEK